jgi:hypothetical protein
MKTGEPKFWPSGDPMYQVIVTVQTQERDPSIQDDDGKRRLFIKGRNPDRWRPRRRPATPGPRSCSGRADLRHLHG